MPLGIHLEETDRGGQLAAPDEVVQANRSHRLRLPFAVPPVGTGLFKAVVVLVRRAVRMHGKVKGPRAAGIADSLRTHDQSGAGAAAAQQFLTVGLDRLECEDIPAAVEERAQR